MSNFKEPAKLQQGVEKRNVMNFSAIFKKD